MTEQEVCQVAEQFVIDSGLDKCPVIAVRRCPDYELSSGWHWVVQFIIEHEDGASADHVLVLIDDETGVAEFFETL